MGSYLAKQTHFTVCRFKLHYNQSSISKLLRYYVIYFYETSTEAAVDTNILCLCLFLYFLYSSSCVFSTTPTWVLYLRSVTETTVALTSFRFMPLHYFWQGNYPNDTINQHDSQTQAKPPQSFLTYLKPKRFTENTKVVHYNLCYSIYSTFYCFILGCKYIFNLR